MVSRAPPSKPEATVSSELVDLTSYLGSLLQFISSKR